MGSAQMGSLPFSFCDRGTFWVLKLTCFYLPKSARAYLFPQSVKINYFCSGPMSVDPIRPQPRNASQGVSAVARGSAVPGGGGVREAAAPAIKERGRGSHVTQGEPLV